MTLGSWLKRFIPRAIERRLRRLLFPQHIEERDIIEAYFADRAGSKHVMIDVGAHFGTSLEPFAQKAFRIFAFEPDPKNRQVLERTVAKYKNVTIDERAVSRHDDEEVAFFTSKVSTGISGLLAFHSSHKETARVKTVRLATFCDRHSINQIDYLKIDTEGFDLIVLQSLDWEKWHPEVILCEFEDRKTVPLGYRLLDLCSFLEARGYALLISEWHPIVEYGKRHRHRRFLTDPKRVARSEAWGNIIAFPSEQRSLVTRLAANLAHVDPPDD